VSGAREASGYLLGSSDHELERLRLQHDVWRGPTDAFLDGLEIAPGARVLDLGCGPGLVTAQLRERVGPSGSVTALDEAPRWVEHLQGRVRERGWDNVRVVQARLPDHGLARGSFELVFLRWVLSFLPRRAELLRELASLLAPGGTLAVMDYNHEGVSLFPPSPGFRAAIRATRAWYAAAGGDPFVMGSILGLLRGAGLAPGPLRTWVLVGPPGSPAFRWADAFFPYHSEAMERAGLLTSEERARFLDEWSQRRVDPEALFYSPIVVGAAARKPR